MTPGTQGSGNSTIQLGSSSAPGLVKILSGATLAVWGWYRGLCGNGIYNAGSGHPLANPGYVDNAGSLIAEGSGSTATINVRVTNEATGTVDVQRAR